MSYNHLIDLNDYSVEYWNSIVSLALDIKANASKYSDYCKNKILATLFYEPSTRTQMSFQTAMIKLGGQVIGFDNPETSSVSKGEIFTDTIQIVGGYADVLVVRHPQEGSARAASLYSDCPVINAGDGGHLHPTQTLTDLVTLQIEKGSLNNLTVGFCGDLRNGRTVHSLIKALSMYKGNKFVLISTSELTLPRYIKDYLHAQNADYVEVESLEENIGSLDMLYMTRIQKERFHSTEEYYAQKNVYILDKTKMEKASENLIVMHPLPRVDEIELDVDKDPRAVYFKQAVYGVYARMALIMRVLEDKVYYNESKGSKLSIDCKNPKCITNTELYLSKSYICHTDTIECEYCDERQIVYSTKDIE